MIAVVTVLLAFPLGLLLSSRTAANLGFVAAYTWAFTFQGVYLLLARSGGDTSAFGNYSSFPWSYGAVTLGVYAVGFGLVELGHRLGAKRRTRRPAMAA